MEMKEFKHKGEKREFTMERKGRFGRKGAEAERVFRNCFKRL